MADELSPEYLTRLRVMTRHRMSAEQSDEAARAVPLLLERIETLQSSVYAQSQILEDVRAVSVQRREERDAALARVGELRKALTEAASDIAAIRLAFDDDRSDVCRQLAKKYRALAAPELVRDATGGVSGA